MFYNLSDAIALHQKARLEGKELYVFPPGINPNDFTRQDVVCWLTPAVSQSSTKLPQYKQFDAMPTLEVATV
jgi:hypothetical protein